MENLTQCHVCGGAYNDENMADWTICRGCKIKQMEEYHGEKVFMDNLGICWTKAELEEAGGLDEVKKMAGEADIRRNNSFKESYQFNHQR